MPYTIVKRDGARPWKVLKMGRVVASCKSKKDCHIFISKASEHE